ncbi:MAG: single-stranded-DNA-specific exonuclease RecJ [Clostridia bacterium]|nr:single-stranded-DNA-specific exonuclease RecJ [Clostridia bacterium]
MKSQKIWYLAEPRPGLQKMLAQELKIPDIMAQILVNRGISSADEAREFLWADLGRLHSPLLLPDLKVAVERIALAVSRGEKILIYGDYDVDGITSTTVLVLTLQKLGAQVEYYIPDRLEEGYGLNLGAMEWAQQEGFSLIVTVDCGISALKEAQWAKEAGIDLIITDHHEVPEELPQAVAVLDPKREDSEYPCPDLAGVGVAFKLAQGLLQHFQPGLPLNEAGKDLLDIAALGTIADIVPLRGENRIIVKYGLRTLAESQRVGIKALKEVCGLAGKRISAGQVGFVLAPRLNATGRLGDAKEGVRLLLSTREEEALSIARELDQGNRERQQIEAEMVNEAVQLIDRFHDFTRDKVILLGRENWHPGVIGIVASRIVERYHRPTILLALDGEQAKGSCRSINGFDMYHALGACKEYLVKFGGHKQAAGLTLTTGNIENFRRAINKLADAALTEEQLYPQVRLDGVVGFSELTLDLVDQLELLQPFGHQNPGPVLACREAKVVECKGVGKAGVHLKLRVRRDSGFLDAIGFQLGGAVDEVKACGALDLAFALEKNEWNNRVSLQLNLKDLKDSAQPDNPFSDQGRAKLTGERMIIREDRLLSSWEGNNFTLVDQRGCQDRDGYVRDLITRGSRALVYVNTPKAVLDLTGYLQGACAESGKQSTNWQVWGPDWGAGIVNPGVEQVILYNLPANNVELRRIMELTTNSESRVQVHLLFGEEEVALNRSTLESQAPGREVLGKLYLLLRDMAKSRNPIKATCSEIAWLLNMKISNVESRTIKVGLEVFAELGLLKTSPDFSGPDREVEVFLQTAPQEKLRLESSARYCAGLAEKAEFERLGRVLLGAQIGF